MLDRVQAYDVYGDFVYVGWQSSDVTVQRSQFARNGRQGWTVNGANVLIQGNSITEVRRSTVDMEPALPTWATSNVVIRDNTVGPGRLLFFASLGAAASIRERDGLGQPAHRTSAHVQDRPARCRAPGRTTTS